MWNTRWKRSKSQRQQTNEVARETFRNAVYEKVSEWDEKWPSLSKFSGDSKGDWKPGKLKWKGKRTYNFHYRPSLPNSVVELTKNNAETERSTSAGIVIANDRHLVGVIEDKINQITARLNYMYLKGALTIRNIST